MRYLKKGYEERVSLDEMWNRIAVKLERSDGLFEEEYTSDWASDERSVDEFGIKEKLIIQRKNSEDLEAEAIRDRALAQFARPAKAVRWQERGRDEGVVMECKGWCHSLDWRYRQDRNGYIANDVVMTTTQYIGYTLYIKKAAQAFVTVGGINLKRVQLRIRREAIPTDNVLVSIQGDSGGNPSGSKLAEWTLPYSAFEDEGFKWINFDLAEPVALSGETKYWIVVERSGVYNDGWYYVWGADETSNYMNNSFKIYGSNWYPRKVNALFRIIGTRETTEQIEAVFEDCNQFMSGIQVRIESGIESQAYDRERVRGLARMRELLADGTSDGRGLTAKVSLDRRLIISEQDVEGEDDHWVNEMGKFFDGKNNPLEEGVYPVGKWVQVKGGREGNASFVDWLEVNAINGKVRYE